MSDVSQQQDAGQGQKAGMDALIAGAMPDFERLPTLQILVDRLAQLMTASLRAITGEDAEITTTRPRPIRCRDFLVSLTSPAMIAVIRIEPWDGYCLAALDPGLVGAAVDLLLGGRRNRGRHVEGLSRPCTAIERTVVERLAADVIARDLGRAFEPVARVDGVLERMETVPGNVAIARPSAVAITFGAEIVMERHRGSVSFLIPSATLDPVKDRLARGISDQKPGGDGAWHAHLHNELPLTSVTLRAVVERRRVSTSDVLRWRVGSHLPLGRRHDDPIELFCRDLLVLHARIAEKDGHIALHVEDRRLAEDWPK